MEKQTFALLPFYRSAFYLQRGPHPTRLRRPTFPLGEGFLCQLAEQRPGGGPGDLGLLPGADAVGVGFEVDEPPAVRPRGEQAVLPFAVDETAVGLADVGLVLFPGNFILPPEQALEIGALLFLRHGVRQLGGRGPPAGGEDKGKQRVVAHFFDEAQRLLKFLLGFPRKSHDDVRGQHDVGDALAQLRDKL